MLNTLQLWSLIWHLFTGPGFKFISYDKSKTVQKMKFSIKDFFSKCNQIRSFLRIWTHLLKKFLLKNIIFVQCNVIFNYWWLQLYFTVLITCKLKFVSKESSWIWLVICKVSIVKNSFFGQVLRFLIQFILLWEKPNVYIAMLYCIKEQKMKISLREKCPHTELLLVCIFVYSDWIRIFTS